MAFKSLRFAAACFILVPAVLPASETLRLRNGYTVEADSHELVGATLIVKLGSGTLQLLAEEVQEIQNHPEIPNLAKTAGSSVKAVADLLHDAALAQGIDGAFVRSVAIVESGLRQSAVSAKGARGLMQLMPGTANELQVDASKAEANAMGGAMYLRKLLLDYKGDSGLALAAYNAGPGAVKRYGGIPPYRETRAYILKVLKEYDRQIKLAAAVSFVSKPSATN